VTAHGAARSVGVVPRALIVLTCLLLAGCGAQEERPAASSASTSLLVIVDADGDGPGAPKQARCSEGSCPAVPAAAFEPASKRMACTDIYGGPQTASVEGTLRGRAVSARFTRQNGCEIARWQRAEPLLGTVR
jgi:hypothetical protein